MSDPGNVGTLLRSAAAFGFRQIVCVGGVDIWSPKVIQASAGVLPLLAIHQVDTMPAGWTAAAIDSVALVASGGDAPQASPILRVPWPIVGNEAHGLPAEVIDDCRHRLTLPMVPEVESLNAAIAGAISCFVLSPLSASI